MKTTIGLLTALLLSTSVHAADAPATLDIQATFTLDDGVPHEIQATLTFEKQKGDELLLYKGKALVTGFHRDGKPMKKKVTLEVRKEDGGYFAEFCFNTFSETYRFQYAVPSLVPPAGLQLDGFAFRYDLFNVEREKVGSQLLIRY